MENLETKILDIVQDDFPIENRPYAVLAERLNSTEKQIFDAIEKMRDSGIIRRIGGVYNSKKLGLISRLCAGKIPTETDSAMDEFAFAVNQIPSITHNYVRDHAYNVWFTVIAESDQDVLNTIERLCSSTKLSNVHSMAAKKMFKINTVMGKSTHKSTKKTDGKALVLTDEDKSRIKLLSGDLPHTLTPFTDLNIPLETVHLDMESGAMRRFGAILRHQQAGFTANAMVCFSVENVEWAGNILAASPSVSHCYERAPFEGFPYNVYAMFHAQNEESLSQTIKDECGKLGNPQFAVLHSIRELKKTSYTYFA